MASTLSREKILEILNARKTRRLEKLTWILMRRPTEDATYGPRDGADEEHWFMRKIGLLRDGSDFQPDNKEDDDHDDPPEFKAVAREENARLEKERLERVQARLEAEHAIASPRQPTARQPLAACIWRERTSARSAPAPRDAWRGTRVTR
jgi:hypothetical protein